jgi:uroporphyrin-3 C-methyltransferase
VSRKKQTKKRSVKAATASTTATTKKVEATGSNKKISSRKKTTVRKAPGKTGSTTKKVPERKAALSRSQTADKSTASRSEHVNEMAAQTQTQPSNNGGARLMLAASLLALLLAAYAVYQTSLNTRVTNAQVAGFDDRLNFIVSEQQSLKSGFNSQTQFSLADIKRIDGSLGSMQSSIAGLQLASQASVDDIKANLGESVARWKLDEVHSLLTRLNRIYQLTGDQAQAIAGLELAQSSLATINNPRLAAVNTALAEDILRVKSDKYVDIASLNDQLLSISTVISELILADDARIVEIPGEASELAESQSAEAQDTGIFAAGKSLFSDIGSLVKYKNLDAPLKPSLDSEARFVVFESLQLKIHGAMLALMRRDNASYQTQLKLAGETLNTYFDMQHVDTQAVSDQLQALRSFDINLNTQAVSRALTALNRVMVMEN